MSKIKKNSKEKPFVSLKTFLEILPFLILLIVSNGLAFAFTANHPQCCDTDWYQSELAKIGTLGYFPHGNISWLSSEHNYVYTTFLYAISKIGLHGRFGATVTQFALLTTILISALFYINRQLTEMKSKYSYLIISLGVFLNLNFTGYGLTEGLAASLLSLYCGIFIMFHINSFSDKWYMSQLISLLALSSLLWMLRPSFAWILFATIFTALIRAWFLSEGKIFFLARELLLSISVTLIIILPQFFIVKQRSVVDSLFHFSEIKAVKIFESSVLRYSTNISSCGPRQLIFSPYSQDVEGIYPAHYLQTFLARFASFNARIVSGWDGLPSSLTYLNNFSLFPGLGITLISGFIFVAPFTLILTICRIHNSWKISLLRLLIPSIFIFSQLTMGLTHGEFRFNIAGWIFGFANLGVLLSYKITRKGLRKYLGAGTLCSLVFLTIGQLTLLFSQGWQTCIG